jgi:predicted esterase
MEFIHRYKSGTEDDKRTLLLLHGTGGDENSLLRFGASIAPTAGLLSPRGTVVENGMPRFFRRFAEGVFDLDDIKARTNDLAAFIKAASETYSFDPEEVVAVGYSNGANIGWSTMLLHPESLLQAILFRPMVTLTDVTAPDLAGKRIFISAGKWDPIVPVENTERLAAQIQGYGADVTLNWHKGGHEISSEEIYEARDWLAKLKRDK